MVVCSGNQQHNVDSCSNDGGSSDLDNYARRYNRLWYQFIYNLAKMGTLVFQNSITNFCHDLWIENQQSWSHGSRRMEMCHQGKGYWSRVHGVSILTKVLSRGTHLKSHHFSETLTFMLQISPQYTLQNQTISRIPMKSLSTSLGIRLQRLKLLAQLMEAIQNQNFIGKSFLSHVSVAIIERLGVLKSTTLIL